MSRTLHHNSSMESVRTKRKKLLSLKQKYSKVLNMEEWYIELPISKNIATRVYR